MSAPVVRIGVAVALPEEGKALARAMRDCRSRHTRAVRRIEGRVAGQPVVVAWAGVGQQSAARSVDVLLSDGATIILAVGFAGSLVPLLQIGDIVAATHVYEADEKSWPSDAGLLGALADAGTRECNSSPADLSLRGTRASLPRTGTRPPHSAPHLHVGPLLTASRIISSAADKRRLGEETGALAVDMESAAVMRRAAQAGVPALALRAISDRADESLPLDFNLCFDSNGQLHLARLLLLLARTPRAVRPLTRVARQSARAGQSISAFVEQHLPRLAAAAIAHT